MSPAALTICHPGCCVRVRAGVGGGAHQRRACAAGPLLRLHLCNLGVHCCSADSFLLGAASGYAPGWGAPSSAGPAAGQLSRLHMRELVAQLSTATDAPPAETVRPRKPRSVSCQFACGQRVLALFSYVERIGYLAVRLHMVCSWFAPTSTVRFKAGC